MEDVSKNRHILFFLHLQNGLTDVGPFFFQRKMGVGQKRMIRSSKINNWGFKISKKMGATFKICKTCFKISKICR